MSRMRIEKPSLENGLRRLIRSYFIAYVVGLILSVAGVVGFGYYQQWQITRALRILTRQSLIVGDLRQSILSLQQFTPVPFDAIRYEDARGVRVFQLPLTGSAPRSERRWLLASVREPISIDEKGENDAGTLVFQFGLLNHAVLAIYLWLVGLLFTLPLAIRGRKQLVLQLERDMRHHEQAKLAEMAAQVSHDIRSPLASLISISHNAHGLDEEVRVQLRTVINRIRDIANGLLKSHREQSGSAGLTDRPSPVALTTEPRTLELLSPLIESVVSEKRLQYAHQKTVEIEFSGAADCHHLFSEIQPVELSRILSNLVNNSIEALERPGHVRIRLLDQGGTPVIEVGDSGKGIPPEILKKLGTARITHGKSGTESGSGLGIYHARTTLESWGGKLEIASIVGSGTQVTLTLPPGDCPSWFLAELRVTKDALIVVLDDDPSIHGIWSRRFRGRTVLSFRNPGSLIDWYRKSFVGIGNVVFLCDYELIGHRHTGLDVIEILGIAESAVLVTSRFEEAGIRARCMKFGVKLLPKSLAPWVRISLLSSAEVNS